MGQNVLYQSQFAAFSRGSLMLNQPIDVLNRWRQAGDIVQIDRFTTDQWGNYARNQALLQSDIAWTDASFIRLKNVSLSYSIPQSLKNRWKVQDLRIFVNAQNLLTLTKYDGLDPETQNSFAVPPLRTFTTGISMGF
jgi:hypothetical protein